MAAPAEYSRLEQHWYHVDSVSTSKGRQALSADESYQIAPPSFAHKLDCADARSGIYQLYWIIIIAVLVKMKYKEGRTELCGHYSKRGRAIEKARRRLRREEGEEEGLLAGDGEPNASGSGSRNSEED